MRETEGGWGGGGVGGLKKTVVLLWTGHVSSESDWGARVPEPEYEMQRNHEELDDIESLTLCVCVFVCVVNTVNHI